jgi:hypothetical protein
LRAESSAGSLLPREPLAAPEPVAEPARKRKPRRLTAGSVVPLVLAVLAAGFAYAGLQDRSAMQKVLVASTYIAPGAPVGMSDTKVLSVHATDQALSRGLLGPEQIGPGLVAAVPLEPGEAVTESELRKASGRPLGEMSIAVPVQQAAGGRLAAGDLVDVIATNANGAYYVAQGVRVVSAAPTSTSGSVLGGGTGSYFVVVAVGKLVALKIAAAIGAEESGSSNGQIELVRSDGEVASPASVYAAPALGASAPRR